MAKNRFAQPLYGKIIYIYETDLKKEELSTIFDPSTYWIDVTGIDCEVGYIIEYADGGGLRFVFPPKDDNLTLDDIKSNKIELMKAERDAREVSVIEYKDVLLDYDDKARERMRIARQALEDNGADAQMWTCADNTQVLLSVQDFKNINTLAAERSSILHEQYNKLKKFIKSCVTEEEIEAVTFDINVESQDEIIEETIS